MQPDTAQKLTSKIQDLFSEEHARLNLSIQQGVSPKDYQVMDNNLQALLIAQSILETFNGEFDKHYTTETVKQCFDRMNDSYEKEWKDLPKIECAQKFMGGVGILAMDIGLPLEAEPLFHLLAQLDPENVNSLLGLAFTKLSVGDTQEALKVLQDKVLTIEPGNDLGLAFLALAHFQLNNTEEALAAASAVIAADRDESAVTLACEIQSWIDKPAAENTMIK
jgi:tetratricopeptide (TPR) repeat protein